MCARLSSKLSGTWLKKRISLNEPGHAALGRRAVVGDDHDQRVLELADVLERVEDPAEVVVGVRDEAGEDLHHPRVQPALVGGQRRPFRDVGVARRELRVGGQKSPISCWRANTVSR